jgi:hypothetical protein
VPEQVRAVPVPVVEMVPRPDAKTTLTAPFTWSAGPEMAAFEALVPVAIPLWHSEQLKELPPWVECLPVEVFGMRWQALHASKPPVAGGTFHAGAAVVWPFLKLPWQ